MSLLPYQIKHVESLIKTLNNHSCAIDASDTGTGKTYCASEICKQKNLKAFIICPLSVLYSWQKVIDSFNIPYLGVANYESIKTGNWFPYKNNTVSWKKEKCPYIKITASGIEWIDLPSDTLFIFDEAHRCKNPATGNAKLVMSTKNHGHQLLLSATLADKPKYFAMSAYMLGLIKNLDEMRLYQKKINANIDSSMIAIHKIIFPTYASRMRIKDIGDLFPENRIIITPYQMDDDIIKEIQEQYEYIKLVAKEAHKLEQESGCKLVQILRARQRIEALKVKTIIELARDALDSENSVVIFVNFLDTMALISTELNIKCQIKGGQTAVERQRLIDEFQTDKENIIILQIQSGGVGISLHDTIGDRPRVAIISPSWSAQDMMQVLGRIHRAMGKTVCIQKMVYCHNTVEDMICKIIEDKVKNYFALNDGDADVVLGTPVP